jgi:DNA-directed RNA polymerase I, II, and III subunit RPABC2
MDDDQDILSEIEDNEEDSIVDEIKPTARKIKSKPIIDDDDDDGIDLDDDDGLDDEILSMNDSDDENDNLSIIGSDEGENETPIMMNPLITNDGNITDSDEDESDDDYDDDYLQKINDNVKNDIITNFHPELNSHNYDEIDTLSKVVRDNDGNIVDDLHQTLPFVTRYEKARILGERAKQLNAGARSFVEVDENVIDGYLIALKEFEEKQIPFIIKRPLPNGGCEYWKLRDLEILV